MLERERPARHRARRRRRDRPARPADVVAVALPRGRRRLQRRHPLLLRTSGVHRRARDGAADDGLGLPRAADLRVRPDLPARRGLRAARGRPRAGRHRLLEPLGAAQGDHRRRRHLALPGAVRGLRDPLQRALRAALVADARDEPEPGRAAALPHKDRDRRRVRDADPPGGLGDDPQRRLPRRREGLRQRPRESSGADRGRRHRRRRQRPGGRAQRLGRYRRAGEGARLMLGLWMFAVVVVLLLVGFPVAFTLGGTAVLFTLLGSNFTEVYLGFALPWDPAFNVSRLNILPQRIFGTIMDNYTLVAVPFFVFMGVMLERSGLAEELLESMGMLFGKLRGGLAISVVAVGALLAASTGVVGASVVTLAVLALPVMLKYGYSKTLSTGVVAASGT